VPIVIFTLYRLFNRTHLFFRVYGFPRILKIHVHIDIRNPRIMGIKKLKLRLCKYQGYFVLLKPEFSIQNVYYHIFIYTQCIHIVYQLLFSVQTHLVHKLYLFIYNKSCKFDYNHCSWG